jgi:recombinase, phage recT family|nr:MAG TPA: RecT protein [Caudoviricetes sp.]
MNKNGSLTQMQQTRNPAKANLTAMIHRMEGEIKKALPSVLTPERFTRIVFTALSANQKLSQCTPQSFLGAMMQAAQLGVEPNTPLGQAYLIPYRNKGQIECQFQLGYKGLIDLAYRSGEVTDIAAHEVHENDIFEYELGLTPKLVHKPVMKNRGPVIAYYAVFHTKSGGYGFQVMSREDVNDFARKTSKAYDSASSPWKTYFDEMAKKTVLKKALKYAPLKTDFARAMAADESIKSSIVENMADLPDETVVTIDAEPAASPNRMNTDPGTQAERAPASSKEDEETNMDWYTDKEADSATDEAMKA